MICPRCRAEYRHGFTRCADCDVLLVPSNPPGYSGAAAPGDPNEDPFCAFWQGEDARLHAELCTVLNEVGIPHKTVQRKDHLFNLANYPSFELGVPFSLFEKAGVAVRDAFELDPSDPEAVLALSMPPLLPDSTQNIRKLPPMLSPAPADAIPGPPTTGDSPDSASESTMAELWSGDDLALRQMLLAALNENSIRSRSESAGNRVTICVAPHNLIRAREILREIVEATPLE